MGTPGQAGEPPPPRWWCRGCEEPVTRNGPGGACHAATGSAECADGNGLASPDRADPAKRRDARELEAEFPAWKVWLPFGSLFFRADFRNPPPGVTVVHYEDYTADGLRRQLAAVTARTAR